MHTRLKNLTLTALFLALGIVLPFLFGQIPQIGQMLLPMHIPVFLCAFLCGWQYAAPMAVVLPLMRSLLFMRPTLYPDAIAIAAEMAVYALVAGLLYRRSPWRCVRAVYRSMLAAMLTGRAVRLFFQLLLLGIGGRAVSLGALFSATVLAGLPGIALQLVIIPAVMLMLRRAHLMPPHRDRCAEKPQ